MRCSSSLALVIPGFLVLVSGLPGAEPAADEYVRVEMQGRLQTGMAAIGGETTGTTISAQGITFELDLSGDPKLATQAAQLDGQRVLVRGELGVRKGVEVARRWIVSVRELAAAPAALEPSAVTGSIVIPATVAPFAGRTLEVKLWEYDPLLADVSATLLDEATIKNFAHSGDQETRVPLRLGDPTVVRKDRRYYVTAFVLKGVQRTHIGELDGRRGLINVLKTGAPSAVNVVMRAIH